MHVSDLNNREFVAEETAWLLNNCLRDLREAATDPNAKFEAVLAVCETTSSLVKKFDQMLLPETDVHAHSADAIPMPTIRLLGQIAAGKMSKCSCGGWREAVD